MGQGIKCRTILWYLTFVGMAVNYMVRININMTIVTMVKQKTNKDNNRHLLAECIRDEKIPMAYDEIRAVIKTIKRQNSTDLHQNESLSSEKLMWNKGLQYDEGSDLKMNLKVLRNDTEKNDVSLERKLLRYLGIKFDENGFNWNEYEQALALGSFFWLHWLTQVPGGILAGKYGGKLIFGVANFISALLCFVMPFASYLSFDFLLVLRVLQGLVAGFAWPAMHTMTASWIPPNERSFFVTAYLGSSFGVFINYPLFGSIISISCWENVFHFCGIFGTLWYIGWLYFVYDKPSLHPRISKEERHYIETSLGTVENRKRFETPWKGILSTKVVWLLVLAQWGGIWGLFTMMTQAPTYLKYIHGLDIKMLGFLSGLPHLLRMLIALLVSYIADYLLQSKKMSRTNVRKMGTALCTVVNGFLVLGLAYSGCSSVAAVFLLSMAVGVHGAVSTGPLAAIVDIGPNFAGITLGISGMIGVVPGFVSPIIVGILTLNNQTSKQWEYVFLITAGMLIFSGIPYLLCGDSDVQYWNSAKVEERDSVELEPFFKEKKAPKKEIVVEESVVLRRNSYLEPIIEDQNSCENLVEKKVEAKG